jgi:hypothetical protein
MRDESNMFEMIGRLFGSQKAGEAIIDGVSNGVDKMFYTDEEKAEDAAKARTEGMQVYMKWLESTSGSRLARRIIALLVTGIWALEHLSSVTLGVVGVFVENADKFIEASEMLATHAQENNTLVGVVLLFYFGGPAAVDGVKGLVQKWVNK